LAARIPPSLRLFFSGFLAENPFAMTEFLGALIYLRAPQRSPQCVFKHYFCQIDCDIPPTPTTTHPVDRFSLLQENDGVLGAYALMTSIASIPWNTDIEKTCSSDASGDMYRSLGQKYLYLI
jgi:hypothetical protein